MKKSYPFFMKMPGIIVALLSLSVHADTLNVRQMDFINDQQQNAQQTRIMEWYRGESVKYNIFLMRDNATISIPADAVPVWKVWRSNDLATLYVNATGTLASAGSGSLTIDLTATQANLPTGVYVSAVQIWQGTNYMGVAGYGPLRVIYSPAGDSLAYVGTVRDNNFVPRPTNTWSAGYILASSDGGTTTYATPITVIEGNSNAYNAANQRLYVRTNYPGSGGTSTGIVSGVSTSGLLTASVVGSTQLVVGLSSAIATGGQWNASVSGASNLAVTASNLAASAVSQVGIASNALNTAISNEAAARVAGDLANGVIITQGIAQATANSNSLAARLVAVETNVPARLDSNTWASADSTTNRASLLVFNATSNDLRKAIGAGVTNLQAQGVILTNAVAQTLANSNSQAAVIGTLISGSNTITLAVGLGATNLIVNGLVISNEITARLSMGASLSNSVNGLAATYLVRGSNLADVASAATARTNLGLASAATANRGDAVFNASQVQGNTFDTNIVTVGMFYSGSGTGTVKAYPLSGDVTSTGTGNVQISSGVVGMPELAAATQVIISNAIPGSASGTWVKVSAGQSQTITAPITIYSNLNVSSAAAGGELAPSANASTSLYYFVGGVQSNNGQFIVNDGLAGGFASLVNLAITSPALYVVTFDVSGSSTSTVYVSGGGVRVTNSYAGSAGATFTNEIPFISSANVTVETPSASGQIAFDNLSVRRKLDGTIAAGALMTSPEGKFGNIETGKVSRAGDSMSGNLTGTTFISLGTLETHGGGYIAAMQSNSVSNGKFVYIDGDLSGVPVLLISTSLGQVVYFIAATNMQGRMAQGQGAGTPNGHYLLDDRDPTNYAQRVAINGITTTVLNGVADLGAIAGSGTMTNVNAGGSNYPVSVSLALVGAGVSSTSASPTGVTWTLSGGGSGSETQGLASVTAFGTSTVKGIQGNLAVFTGTVTAASFSGSGAGLSGVLEKTAQDGGTFTNPTVNKLTFGASTTIISNNGADLTISVPGGGAHFVTDGDLYVDVGGFQASSTIRAFSGSSTLGDNNLAMLSTNSYVQFGGTNRLQRTSHDASVNGNDQGRLGWDGNTFAYSNEVPAMIYTRIVGNSVTTNATTGVITIPTGGGGSETSKFNNVIARGNDAAQQGITNLLSIQLGGINNATNTYASLSINPTSRYIIVTWTP